MAKLFLPFTSKGKAIERKAIGIKQKLGLGPYASIDPYNVLDKINAKIISIRDINLPEHLLDSMLGEVSEEWSAIGVGKSPIDGKEVIFLNPNDYPVRQKVSLMEEIVHIILDHPKVQLTRNKDTWRRSYTKIVEDEAFCVGAACIIPYRSLFNMLKNQNRSIAYIAEKYSVSTDYVIYRCKRAGLYNLLQKVLS